MQQTYQKGSNYMKETNFRLVVSQSGSPEQEFELNKSSVTLGRATTNDVILSDARVSRSHVRLDCSSDGCTVVDLGSSNGTRLNGQLVTEAEIHPGDVLGLGSALVRFEVARPAEDAGLTVIDSEADLDKTLLQEVLPVSVHETGVPRLVVLTPQRTWEVPLRDADSVSLGRDEANDLALDLPKVSRRHAEVVRKGDSFLLRDLGSTNGTVLRGSRVTEQILEDGDAFRIGDAQILFKAGFQQGALTLEAGSSQRSARRPVVFVPGLMGSQLWLGSERIWPNVKVILKNPEILRYPSEAPLEPRGIVEEVVIVPNLIKQDQYNRLGDYLIEELGYERGSDFFEFAYDWRQDVRTSARQLAQAIESLPVSGPIILVGHSLGTLVSRYYVERLGGKARVERLILMGGPHTGAVKGLSSLLIAPQVLPFGLMGERLRQVCATFVTSYQILPTYACGVDQHGHRINFLEDESWVDEKQLPLLRAAREFRRELGHSSSVPTISVFGYGLKTISTISLQRDTGGRMSGFVYRTETAGDSSVPEQSAVLTGTEIHPVQQYHGSLFVDNDVKMRLKLELTRKRAS